MADAHLGRHPRSWDAQVGKPVARARIERFAEPALLLRLRGGPAHGYEIGHALEEWLPEAQPDMGYLYRLLRHLEQSGIVSSDWSDRARGPARRTYRLTALGDSLLDSWVESLIGLREVVGTFVDRAGAVPAMRKATRAVEVPGSAV